MLINKGGLVSCTHCTATWETWRQHGVCEYCERHMEIDAGSRACADCLTFKGDGVGHANVCDHDACVCDMPVVDGNMARDMAHALAAMWTCGDEDNVAGIKAGLAFLGDTFPLADGTSPFVILQVLQEYV